MVKYQGHIFKGWPLQGALVFHKCSLLHLILQILCLTGPDAWSASAFYQSTRLFASNMNAKMAQR